MGGAAAVIDEGAEKRQTGKMKLVRGLLSGLQLAAAVYCGWLWLLVIGLDFSSRFSGPGALPGGQWFWRMGATAVVFGIATRLKGWMDPKTDPFFGGPATR